MFNEVTMQECKYTKEQVEKLVEIFKEVCEKHDGFISSKAHSKEMCLIVYCDRAYEDALGITLDEFGDLTGLYEWWGYGDEYSYCEHCCGVVKLSSSDSVKCEDYLLCLDCAEDCAEEIIENEYVNNPNRALVNFKDKLKGMNFIKQGEYESGWHGVNDDPKKVFNKIKKDDNEVLFVIDRMGQFATEYSAYTRSV